MEKRRTLLESGLLWFGAAVSIAEILAGMLLAPMGIMKAVLAIGIGHCIGGLILFLAGYMGAQTGMGAMDTVKLGFGRKGAYFFALLNMIQLSGWGAIMIYESSVVAESILGKTTSFFPVIIGVLIILWILVDREHLKKINIITMMALFFLAAFLCKFIMEYRGLITYMPMDSSISFGTGVELATILSLSWLPVISDYTKDEEKPLAGTIVSVLVYSIVSSWMYLIGVMIAIYMQSTNLVEVLSTAYSGVAVLVLIVLAAVTTSFMDFLSTGYSGQSVVKQLPAKLTAVIVTVIAVTLSYFYNMSNIAPFLMAIGAVFTPMIGVLLVQYYIFRKREENISFKIDSFVVWLLGMVVYYYLTAMKLSFGVVIPDIIVTIILTYFVGILRKIAHNK